MILNGETERHRIKSSLRLGTKKNYLRILTAKMVEKKTPNITVYYLVMIV
jgi:hypothetical protein